MPELAASIFEPRMAKDLRKNDKKPGSPELFYLHTSIINSMY